MMKGQWLRRHVRDLSGHADMTARVVDEIVRAIAEIRGTHVAETIRRDGVQHLHDVIDARQVTPLRDRVLDTLRLPLLQMAVTAGREALGWAHDFFVDDYLILRTTSRSRSRGGPTPEPRIPASAA